MCPVWRERASCMCSPSPPPNHPKLYQRCGGAHSVREPRQWRWEEPRGIPSTSPKKEDQTQHEPRSTTPRQRTLPPEPCRLENVIKYMETVGVRGGEGEGERERGRERGRAVARCIRACTRVTCTRGSRWETLTPPCLQVVVEPEHMAEKFK